MEMPTLLTIETEREANSCGPAEVLGLPGVLAYGATPEEAQGLAFRVLAER